MRERARAPRAAASKPRVSGTLRVLPLGGLGEIGKNMTVVEYDGRIVVVDTGLRFPTADMLGIDLVLPDFAYLRDRVERHRGDRHHPRPRGSSRRAAVGPARARRTAPAGVRRPADDRDGALEARRAQPARRAARGPAARRRARARPVHARARPHDPFDPRLVRGRADHRARHGRSSPATTSSTRRRSTACPPTSRGWPSSAATACCCCAATRPTPTGPGSRRPSAASGRISRRCSRAPRGGSS